MPSSSARRRVAVTGLGVVSSLGSDVETFWASCLAGGTAVEEVPAAWRRHSPGLRSRFWAPLSGWDRETPLASRLERKQLDPVSRIGLLAAEQALGQAGLGLAQSDARRNTYALAEVDPRRAAVFLGTGIGGVNTLSDHVRFVAMDEAKKVLREIAEGLPPETLEEPGEPAGPAALRERLDGAIAGLPSPRLLNPFAVSMIMPNAAAAVLSIKLGCAGPCRTFCCACASATMALGQAFRAVRDGECDLALSGGVEYLEDPCGCTFRGFDLVGALVAGDLPAGRANRPFDEARSGFLFSAGGGAVLVLEELGRARERGAPVLAEIRGYGETADAHSMMALDPSGEEIRRAIEICLAEAGLEPEAVGYVNAHGTGTPANDAIECGVLAGIVPQARINSTKSLLGHTLGASGALEAVVTVLTLRDGVAHPCRNLERPIADLPFITAAAPFDPDYALSQSFAFGGQNAVLAFSRAGAGAAA